MRAGKMSFRIQLRPMQFYLGFGIEPLFRVSVFSGSLSKGSRDPLLCNHRQWSLRSLRRPISMKEPSKRAGGAKSYTLHRQAQVEWDHLRHELWATWAPLRHREGTQPGIGQRPEVLEPDFASASARGAWAAACRVTVAAPATELATEKGGQRRRDTGFGPDFW